MYKHIFFFISFIIILGCSSNGQQPPVNASAKGTLTIRGKVGYPQNGTITIMELKQGGKGWQDTIMLKSNYSFAKRVKVAEPGYYRISFYNQQVIDIILDKNDLEINVDGNSPSGFYEIKGSPDIELIQKVNTIVRGVDSNPEVARLNSEYVKAQQANNQKSMAELRDQYMSILGQANDKAIELIKSQPPMLGVINLLQGNTFDKDKYFDVYLSTAEKLKKEWPNYAHAKEFIDMVEKMKVVAIGQVAPEIALPNPDGQIVKLSSLRGKYVLVDFWAKWCGPCRRENPNVVKAYAAHKSKGFEVFGVSLDRNKEDWVKAIKEDNLTWTHVSDLKYFQSEAAELYNINAIPFSLLLDPKGVIIAKNLRGEELHKKLEEIFSKQNSN
jgi:peroxiredoxin